MRSVPLKRFHVNTRFAIKPDRIEVVDSMYKGCIAVHLANYNQDTKTTAPGGAGLCIASHVDFIDGWTNLYDELAVVAGFDEVFEIVCIYDGIVVLRPLDKSLGVRWERFQQYRKRNGRNKRSRQKNASKAAKFLFDVRHKIRMLTGTLPGRVTASDGPYFLHEWNQKWSQDTPVKAYTLEEARQAARQRIEQLRACGWRCDAEAPQVGEFQREDDVTSWWLCKLNNRTKRLSIEASTPKVNKPQEKCSFGVTAPTAAEIEAALEDDPNLCFTADSCPVCYATANPVADNAGWFCRCGHFNLLPWHNHTIPHEVPELGPPLAAICAGIGAYRRKHGGPC